MKESTILKRSAFMYAFSILITGMVNFIAIPVLKQKIGASEFAYLNLYMNLLLVVSYIGAGWLVQSCIRFYPAVGGQVGFNRIFMRLALISGGLTSILAFVLVLFFRHYAWMLLAFPVTLFCINMQSIMVAWMQASIRPKVVAMAEILRSMAFLGVILSLQNGHGYQVVMMAWVGWLASYLISLLLMLVVIKKYPIATPIQEPAAKLAPIFSKFAAFGFPLSLWLVGSFGLFYIDRFILLRYLPAAMVGHYSALFDVLHKGMGFVLSPLVTAVYPLLARLHEDESHDDVKKLGRKVLKWQGLITVVAIIGYILAWPIVKKILAIDEAEHTFFISGLLVLSGAAIWQMNVVLHKPFELRHRTLFLLGRVAICLIGLLLADGYVIPRYGFVGAAAVFFSATVLYGLFILIQRRKELS